jgi:hypothetical protein
VRGPFSDRSIPDHRPEVFRGVSRVEPRGLRDSPLGLGCRDREPFTLTRFLQEMEENPLLGRELHAGSTNRAAAADKYVPASPS